MRTSKHFKISTTQTPVLGILNHLPANSLDGMVIHGHMNAVIETDLSLEDLRTCFRSVSDCKVEVTSPPVLKGHLCFMKTAPMLSVN